MMPLVLAPAWVAAAIDIRTRRIPDWLSVAALAVALVIAAFAGNLAFAAAGALAAFGVGLGIAVISRGGFGGGDVKLMAYAGAVVGLPAVPGFLFWMSVAGGLLALGVLLATRRRGTTLPYAPAIAIGVTVTMLAA